MTPARNPLNQAVVDAAAVVQDAIRADLFARIGHQAAVVAAAPAGAGKSHFVSETVGQLRNRGLRVALLAPTNEQAHSLVERVKILNPALDVAFIHAQGRQLPDRIARLRGVTQPSANDAVRLRSPLVIATIDKASDAYLRSNLGGFDVLVMDEAYQADAARYYTAANVAPTHLLVGDAGQLDPFSTVDDATYWRGGPEDPLQTAVGVLVRNHLRTTPLHRLPVTRRLDPRAVPFARCFYPGHDFESAVLPGVRRLRLAGGVQRGRNAKVDRVLDAASSDGWAYVTLPGAPVLTADPVTATLIVDMVGRLLARHPESADEDHGYEPVRPDQIAVGVSHNDQKDLLRARFDQANLSVVVDTANRLQGLTFEVVVVWHPLAGATEADAFHLDPGRLCVLLTRHRQACIVVGRDTDRALLDGIPPATPGYLGWDPDPVLDGWEAHEAIFSLLEPHRFDL